MDDRIRPLKQFGQNYLKDKNILINIAEEISPKQGDNIIEIGPGTGALTDELLKRIDHIKAAEIDTRVAAPLKEKYGQKLELIEGDFMKLDLSQFGTKLRVVGNIPYNITSPILFKLFEHHSIVKDAVLLMQLEVAERIISEKGNKQYGILSVISGFFTDIKLVFKISPNVFFPKPKVWSALMHFHFKEVDITPQKRKIFIQTVKAAFGNRRKTLKNSLSNSIFKPIDFSQSGIDISLRAEQLSIEQFVQLSEYILKQQQ